jgi:heptosyltransferase-2
MRWGALGDVVVCTAILEDLHRGFPGCEIDFNTIAPCDRLFEADPRISRIVCIDVRSRTARWRAVRQWLRTVRENHYDLIIDLQCNDRSRLLLALMQLSGGGIPYRLGTRNGWPYNVAVAARPSQVPALEYYRAPLASLGVDATTARGVVHPGAVHEARAAKRQADNDLRPGNYIVFMPGSAARGRLKRWGAAHYAALAKILWRGGVERIVLVGSRDDSDECEAIAGLTGKGVVNLCNQTEVLELAALCADARCVIANDTGTAHLAAAAAAPTVVICGPTDPRRVKPPGDNIIAVQTELPCINCYRKTCSHHSCMLQLMPDAVMHAIERLNWRGEPILR